ncbi:hypothetical protein PVT67_15355 [Gallaecimonas kandeliae]|uniref:hypothetical protein n=1 Tax=Gallaecimonas kandeliae TaxID=3029055 RepID=UPI002648AF26|nr:hypothetical protein [Gallaecimonas kandeliae]WKE65021.1 hypothetical protein PVT67_15355 [Gallaecimonas kandeliae]
MNVNSTQVNGGAEALSAHFTNNQIRRQGAMALELMQSAAQAPQAEAAPKSDGPLGQHVDIQV